MCEFTIKGAYFKEKCFPGLNDMLHEAERHPQAYNRLKREFTMIAVNSIRKDLKNYKADCKIRLDYTFGEPNHGQRRDYDNIVAGGRKIITDALVKCGTIKDDSPKFLDYGNNDFVYVSDPFITVKIIKVETPDEQSKEV